MANLSPAPKLQFFDSNGNLLVGGKLYSYAAGTTTPLATFADYNGVTANPNPIILDSRGEAGVWLNNSLYKLKLTSATDVEIWTVDNIGGPDQALLALLAAPGGAALIGNTPSGTISATTVQGAINEIVSDLAASSGSSLVGFLQTGTGAQPRTAQSKMREMVSVKDFGAVGDGVANDTAAIQAAIDYVAGGVSSIGGVVYFPTGTYLISSRINMPNRVGLQGANGRATIIKPHSTFSDSYMFHAVNGTSSMFGSYIRDMWIDARGKNMTAVVWSQAWQETCGMERVLIQFDGTTPTGFLYTDGYGGAAYLPLRDIEIFADSTAVAVRGIWVQQISLVGGFLLSVDGITIAGSPSNFVDVGIDMVNDSLVCKGYHAEFMNTMCGMDGAGSLSADSWTGSSSGPTVDMVTVASTFTGKVSLRNMLPNGSTGNVFRNNIVGRNIPASEGMLAEYTYQPSSFLATVGTQIDNVTGNGTEYIVVFNTEVYDYLGEYNPVNGTFTAARSGKYLLTCCLKMNIPAGSTSAVVRVNTSNRIYEAYRGSFANQRDSSNNVTINGAVLADLDAGDIARISVLVSGIGADTVDILASDGSVFSGQWMAR